MYFSLLCIGEISACTSKTAAKTSNILFNVASLHTTTCHLVFSSKRWKHAFPSPHSFKKIRGQPGILLCVCVAFCLKSAGFIIMRHCYYYTMACLHACYHHMPLTTHHHRNNRLLKVEREKVEVSFFPSVLLFSAFQIPPSFIQFTKMKTSASTIFSVVDFSRGWSWMMNTICFRASVLALSSY